MIDNGYKSSGTFDHIWGLASDIEFAQYLKDQTAGQMNDELEYMMKKSKLSVRELDRHIEKKSREIIKNIDSYIDYANGVKYSDSEGWFNDGYGCGYIKLYEDLVNSYLRLSLNKLPLWREIPNKYTDPELAYGINGEDSTSRKYQDYKTWMRLADIMFVYGIAKGYIKLTKPYDERLLSGLTREQFAQIADEERNETRSNFGKTNFSIINGWIEFYGREYGEKERQQILRGGVKKLNNKKEFEEIKAEQDKMAENNKNGVKPNYAIAPFIERGEKVFIAQAEPEGDSETVADEYVEVSDAVLAKLGREAYLKEARLTYQGLTLKTARQGGKIESEDEQSCDND